MNIWSNNQSVMAGDTVFLIALLRESFPVGKTLLPIQNSGKVKPGQQVNVRLNNYPDQEFGYVKGVVANISPVLHSRRKICSRSYPMDFTPIMRREMKGGAETVTEDQRLVERLLVPL